MGDRMNERHVGQAWVFWDGTCGFCRRAVAWVKRHDQHERLFPVPYQHARHPPMTPDLARRCQDAIHVMTPDGTVLSAGRASLYVMDAVGWHRFSRLFSRRPLLWLVEAIYRLVAGHRQLFSRLLFRPRLGLDAAATAPSARPTCGAPPREQVAWERPESREVRLQRLRLAVCLALAGGLLLSLKLWVSSRSYPLMPVSMLLPAIPFPLDYAVLVALILLLGAAAAARRPGRALAAILIVAVGLGLLDQARWQPWFYQYVVMLGAVALCYRSREQYDAQGAALNTCRVIVASIYLWSGLHKVNGVFVNETFPWLFQGLYGVPAETLAYVSRLGAVVPIVEAGIGVGLITARLRLISMIMAIPMHIFILASLGPLGHNIDRAVWPWNLAMIAFLVLLFRGTAPLPARDILSPRNGWYHGVVLVLFGMLPALSFVNLWDSYLSFALFSGDVKGARIYVSDGIRAGLPSEVGVYVRADDGGRNLLDHVSWSNEEMNVPVYPETRIYHRLGRYACGYAKAPTDVEVVIAQRSPAAVLRSLAHLRLERPFWSTTRYNCGSLRE
jgi:predicted DCC family thiol-disulfide oxidoreductase YuxK/uncharacterized membrane protein YphA (DoxX/SURF4 family)